MKYGHLLIFIIIIGLNACSGQSVRIINNQSVIKKDNLREKTNLQSLNKSKIIKQKNTQYTSVIAKGVASCGKLSIKKCKELAYTLALENAAKQGADIFIESFSEVENAVLIRDNITAKLIAKVVNHTVINQGMDGESGYFYEISALVERIIKTNVPYTEEKDYHIDDKDNPIPEKNLSNKKNTNSSKFGNLPQRKPNIEKWRLDHEN